MNCFLFLAACYSYSGLMFPPLTEKQKKSMIGLNPKKADNNRRHNRRRRIQEQKNGKNKRNAPSGRCQNTLLPRLYEVDENDLSGSHAADLMGVDHDTMYKTLVLHGDKKGYLVCCIPVDEELDLKKAAKAAGEKKVEMIHVKDMLGITGYIRGGCSPIGMKKKFPTFIEETAQLYDAITVSAASGECR